ncbi:MAG: DNA methyltransferase [Planctomycetota bacterium]
MGVDTTQLDLFDGPAAPYRTALGELQEELRSFCQFGTATLVRELAMDGQRIPMFVNEFWTARQRAANSLHEISFRACFKGQLPGFFVERLTVPGDHVYDPFMGRGTTLIEAALSGRVPLGCDINPLCALLTAPRLAPPTIAEIAARLESMDLSFDGELPEDLLVFYHRDTLAEICALREQLAGFASGADDVDNWIRMVATNRLTGHSKGFFSVYTMPPNQAVSVGAQRKINARRNQAPEYRDVKALILRKSRSLLTDVDDEVRATLASIRGQGQLLTSLSHDTPQIPDESVSLVVTSPPFLDVVQYADDNWLRCWFCGIDPESVPITMARRLDQWQDAMTQTFQELRRILRPGGHVAFEVGEVRGGTIKLEEAIVPCGLSAGLTPVLLLINDQKFTKTANCWGVDNNKKGTNTNRVVLFRK